MNKDTYRKTVERQRRDRTVTTACVICGEDDPRVIELHHLDGRNNSDETIPLCKNHHTIVTDDQNKVPPNARSKKASPQEKIGYLLVTHGSLLELSGKHLKNLGYEMIRNE
jgi:hypothetical protein